MKPIPPADLHQDLLSGFPHGWKDGKAQPLDLAQLVRHFRRLPKRLSEGPVVCLLTTSGKRIQQGQNGLLYVALAEIGWKISKRASRDALALALSSQPPQAPPPPARPREEEFF
jgi:hypothetical protein